MKHQNKSLTIPLENVASSPLFIGGKTRLSCATSVSILDDNHLACAHFAGQKIYIYKFDINSGQYEMTGCADTTYNGKLCKTDLMTSNGDGKIAVSNFLEKSCTLYKYTNQSINFSHYIPHICGDFVHGVKFYNDNIIAMTSRRAYSGVYFVNISDGSTIFTINTNRNSVQDVCFINDSKLVLISTSNTPKMRQHDMWSSFVDIYDYSVEGAKAILTGSIEFPNSQLDNLVLYNSNIYITNQYQNLVLVMCPISGKIVNKYAGFEFPHGIDVSNGLMAVSNYGTNTIEIRKLGENLRE